VVAVVIWVAARFGSSNWFIDVSQGSGAAGVFVGQGDILLPAIIGFALGCWWSVRKRRRMTTR
jgi:hypothetical protein